MNMPAGPVLRDIHLPAEPSWWPPAPGWWVLAALALAGLAYLFWQALRQRRLAQARRALRREFDQACASRGVTQVAALSELLRRAALRYAPTSAVLRDEDWLAFLDADDVAQPFRRGPGRLLLDGPYRAHVEEADAAALALIVRERLDRFVTLHSLRTASRRALPAEMHEKVQMSPVPSAQGRPDLRDIRASHV